MATEQEVPVVVPEGYTLHTENTSRILLPPNNEAFLNPVQEFNRDLSVACIRTWSELLNEEKEAKFRQNLEKWVRKQEKGPKAKRVKTEGDAPVPVSEPQETAEQKPSDESAAAVPEDAAAGTTSGTPKPKEYRPYKSIILEALSATGLRSIRYAKEIPLICDCKRPVSDSSSGNEEQHSDQRSR